MPATLYQLPIKAQHLSPNASMHIAQPRNPLPDLGQKAMECLLALSQPQSGASSSDHALALELLALAGGEGSPAEYAALQRINLVDQMFNQLLAEQNLPANCRRMLEPLRFSMIKNALVDVGVLTQPQHPLRQMLSNTMLSAITACTKDSSGLRQIESRMRDLPSLVDLSASFVVPALPNLQPLTNEQVSAFQEQLTAQAAERKQTLTDMVGRTVSRQLEEMTLGLKLPAGVVSFMQFGIHPLLCAIMLKHGMDSVRWTAEISRVHSLLTSFEPANAARATDRSGLISNLILDMSGIGMPQDRIQKLVSLLNTSGPAPAKDRGLDLSLHRM